MCDVIGTCLRLLAVRHIARGEHDAANRMVQQIAAQGLEVDPMSVRVTEAELDRLCTPLPLQQPLELRAHALHVLRMDRCEGYTSDQRTGRVTQQPRGRRRFVKCLPALVVHGDDVLRLLDQSAEGLIAGMDSVHAAARVAAAICGSGAPFWCGVIQFVSDHKAYNLDSSVERRKLFKNADGILCCGSFAAPHEKSMN